MMERMGRSSISAIGRIYKCSKYMLLENNRKHWTTATCASLSIHYDKPVCTRCYQLQFTSFHTTSDVTAKKHSKKTLKVKQVHFKKDKAGKVVPISTDMTVTELAETLESDVDHVRKVLSYTSARNQFAKCSPDTVIEDIAVIKEVIEKSGYRWLIESKKKKVEKDNKDAVRRPPPEADVLVKRPPVVTIMGHVDHGKTTLLDALRHSNIVAKEFGGITQHIGAFSVKLPSSGEMITFLDTPGHAAFSAMRARGAHATDIVVLVVAADDGVMKQTIESLSHAKDSHVPIVVAVNKCDKPEADVESTKHELTQHGLMSEDLGGDTQVIPISALKGTNLEVLQEAILAQAELLELGCDPAGLVEGVVIESCMDPGRGKLSTVLIQRGTLKKGSYLVAGLAHAKVRGMFNDMGRPVQEVTPGMAVEVIGWRELPSAGDLLLQVETEHRAREVIHWRQGQERSKRSEEELKLIQARIDSHDKEYKEMRKKMVTMGIRRAKRMPWTDRKKEAVVEHEGPEVAVVIKGDVDGTVEAILDALDTYSSDQCRLHLLSYGVGDVTEHDIEMAAAFKGELFAFNVNSPERINNLAKTKGVEIHHHNVIYKMMDELRDNLQKKLPAVEVEEVIGEANVLQTFMISDGKHKLPVAGCLCTKGQLKKKKSFKLLRDEEVIFDGPLSSLKHFKNEVDTIKTDVECGVCFHDKHIIPSPEDRVICYEKKKQKQILEWDLAF